MENPDRKPRKAAPLALLTVAALAAGLIGYLRADPDPGHDRVYLRNSGGPVLFTHASHAERAGDCVVCHHELAGAVTAACTDCHDEGYEADLVEHADLVDIPDHECAACHEIADAATVTGCRGCHPAAAIDGPPLVACTECHDDPDYRPGLFSHADLLEIEAHGCAECHNARPVSEVYHDQCNGCHLDQRPERFATADGHARCTACHLE